MQRTSIQELTELRNRTRRAVANKIIAICKYAEENHLTKVLEIRKADSDFYDKNNYVKILIVADGDSGVEYIKNPSQDFDYITHIANGINCNYEKNRRLGCFGREDVCDSFYPDETDKLYAPTISQCAKWCKETTEKLAELENKEFEELNAILKELE